MSRSEKTDRAARTFKWLRCLQSAIGTELSRKLDKGDGRNLRPLDLCVAVSLTGWFDADLRCFRSQAAIAEDVGCSEKSAAASVARLLDAGFLIVPPVKKTMKGGFGGRPATTYRATIPAADRISGTEVSGTTVRENDDDAQWVSGTTVRGVSGSTVPEVSGSTVPTNPWREPMEEPLYTQTVYSGGFDERVVQFPKNGGSKYFGGIDPRFKSVIDEFNHVWAEWPWRDRDLAERPEEDILGITRANWCTARKVASYEQITQVLGHYVDDCERTVIDDEYVTRLRYWLEGKRWTDEYGEAPTTEGEPDFLSKAGTDAMERFL
jgi:hypothetical protein